ncbi:MAG: acetyltransferase domain protein [Frankiales bacterium]|nr:acetyltransferase domain protein [Frankiales bacterium]
MTWATGRSQRDQWCSAASAPDSLMLIAEECGQVRGKAVLDFKQRRDAAWLWLVSVDPAHRGKGVGTALIWAAETQALAREHHIIELAVDDVNPRARALYERLGYRPVGPYVDMVRYIDDEGNRVCRDEPGVLLRRHLK